MRYDRAMTMIPVTVFLAVTSGVLFGGSLNCLAADAETENQGNSTGLESTGTIEAPDGYHLVWNDEFDEENVNEEDWNFEVHETGWVNHELQEYITGDECSYIDNGILVIQPVMTENEDGSVSYYSARLTTQNKHDFKYGRMEARLKVPQGKGFLPAFWLMATDEELYGQWPKCGEIDIMEVLGDSTNMLYGTLHCGEPHQQRQGTYSISDGDFSTEYHVFAVEWDSGEVRWYVDGEEYYKTSDWFSAVEGEAEKPYPAPFNQDFYMILNVAVGGDWPGSPDESTIFDDRAAMYVDYVRVFQKEEYDENVEKPVDVPDMREADESGNYVRNWDFSEEEDLTDDDDWKFLLFNGGKGAAEIGDQEIIITSEAEGTEEYSVQLVQPGMPIIKGAEYRLSFEACAEEERTMKAAVTAPDVNWIRYFPDTSVDLKNDWQTYEFTFKVDAKDDDNGRVEFNMGKTGSTATIHIRNVRLERIG